MKVELKERLKMLICENLRICTEMSKCILEAQGDEEALRDVYWAIHSIDAATSDLYEQYKNPDTIQRYPVH